MTEFKEKSIAAAKKVIRLEAAAVAALEEKIDENFVKAVKLILDSNGRVIITGIGKSGAIAKKISATLSSTGTTSYFLHATEGLHGDLGMVHRDDVVICISKSGETEEIFGLLAVFKKLEIPIIAITANPNSTLAKYSSVVLDIGGGEEACPHNLAPTTSTTATLAMGDALAIALLEHHQFTRDDFAFLHPGGSLGKKLLIKVDDIMESGNNLPFCKIDDNMKTVTIEMAHKRGICPIVDEHMHVIGVITTGDLNRLLEQTELISAVKAREVMNTNPKIIQSGTLAVTALQKMEDFRVVALPVIDSQKKLIGIIHLHDIMQKGISL